MSHFQKKHHAALMTVSLARLKPGDILLTDAGSKINVAAQVLSGIPAGHTMLYTGSSTRYASRPPHVIDHPPLEEHPALDHFERAKIIRIIGIHAKKLTDEQRNGIVDFARSMAGQVPYNGGMLALQGMRAILRSVGDRGMELALSAGPQAWRQTLTDFYAKTEGHIDATVLEYANRWINGQAIYERDLICSAMVALSHAVVGAPISRMKPRTVGTQDIWHALQRHPDRYEKAFDLKFGPDSFDEAAKQVDRVGRQLRNPAVWNTNLFR